MSKISINIVQGTLRKDKYFFGIDLGTTNSLISATDIEKNESQIIQFVNDNALIPSVIYFHKGGKISVGHEAKSLMKEDPENGISSVKRLIGLTKNEIETLFPNLICEENEKGECRVGKTTNHLYTPIELSSFILKEIKEKTEEKIKNKVEKIVITVPAYFNDLQRQATHKAANLAGLQVLRMINEPTAASLAYGIGKNSEIEKIIAVYDLGGGTFDISILRVVDGVFDVLSTHGNTALGGDDFDNAIVQFWKEKYPLSEFTYKPETLINKAEQAKKELNEKEESIQDFLGLDLKISKIEFEKIAQKLISETLYSCTKALTDAGLQKNEIDEIILVGGSTRMYLIKEKLKEFFGKTLNDSLNPDEAVALGAGIQAGILAGNNQELLLLDVTPLSLGIETMGGLMDVVIPRNSKIPCSFSKNYTTQKDGQTKIEISIYQGERELVENNISLGKFILEGIPSMPASLPKIEVNFYIDTNGLLQVKAKELRSGAIQSIEVKPKDFIDDTVVEKFLKESIEFAEDDINNRKVLDAKNEAVLLLDATAKFMRIHAANMQDTDIQLMNEASLELKNELESKDLEKIKAAIENLNRVGRPYAEDLMDHTISDALKGKQV